MFHSDDIKEIATALSKFQGNLPNVVKNKKVKVPTKNGKEYSYQYADLTAIWDAIRKPLMECGLSITQLHTSHDSGLAIVTILMHSSGQWIRSDMNIIHSNNLTTQDLGSKITYFKRYSLASILGISADEDDDANQITQVELTQDTSSKSKYGDLYNCHDLEKIIDEQITPINPDYKKNILKHFQKSSINLFSSDQLHSLYKNIQKQLGQA